jgi:hypothetical protein
MYDYALGGKDNFEVDRTAVHAVGEIIPEFRDVALANRGFLIRAVETMARQGIEQFIDIGTGIPTSPNVHEIAQQLHPDARVVYVDNDPIVMAHNRALRARRPGVMTLQCDLRSPELIMQNPGVRKHLDFDRPIGLLFVAVLHFVRRDLAVEVVNQYRRSLPAGSYLVISSNFTCRIGAVSYRLIKVNFKTYINSLEIVFLFKVLSITFSNIILNLQNKKMSNFTGPIFTDINNLPFTSNEKAELRYFFTNRDSTIVENVLSTITEVDEKADYLRIYFKSTIGEPLRHSDWS